MGWRGRVAAVQRLMQEELGECGVIEVGGIIGDTSIIMASRIDLQTSC